jgi:hypothetical protein
MTLFARGIGAARSGDPAAAEKMSLALPLSLPRLTPIHSRISLLGARLFASGVVTPEHLVLLQGSFQPTSGLDLRDSRRQTGERADEAVGI